MMTRPLHEIDAARAVERVHKDCSFNPAACGAPSPSMPAQRLAAGSVHVAALVAAPRRQRTPFSRALLSLVTPSLGVVGGPTARPASTALKGRNSVASGHEPGSQAVRDSAEVFPVVGVVFHARSVAWSEPQCPSRRTSEIVEGNGA